MNDKKRISAFSELGNYILENPDSLQEIIQKSYIYNNWFTIENSISALQNIAVNFLNQEKLSVWKSSYKNVKSGKSIAIVAAGNIPMVAFHDVLCVLISGNILQLKLSEKDKYLIPHLLQKLIDIEPVFKEYIFFTERMTNFEAIIATGSNNTASYFEQYFGKYKNIIRRNRNSVAILTGNETENELELLGNDVFNYFGLGCRNVSKLFVPKSYDLMNLKQAWKKWSQVLMNHNSYRNNLDYQRTLYLMNQTPLQNIDFVNIVENKSLHSPISCLHIERYETKSEVENFIESENENIQCIVGENYLAFGKSQQPELNAYADNIDTMNFILSI